MQARTQIHIHTHTHTHVFMINLAYSATSSQIQPHDFKRKHFYGWIIQCQNFRWNNMDHINSYGTGSLNPAKAPGPDNIPNQVLKTFADQIASALCSIYQKSLDTGTLPADWLEANISCVFKKGDSHQPENYRPISLTSVPCKILEHIICHHIHLHLESNNILTHLNHGFRSGYSCESQLLTTTHDFLNSFNQKKQVDIAILDCSKAFDTVLHRKLLHKLSNYGITGPLHQWLTTFLTHRTMNGAWRYLLWDNLGGFRSPTGDRPWPAPLPPAHQWPSKLCQISSPSLCGWLSPLPRDKYLPRSSNPATRPTTAGGMGKWLGHEIQEWTSDWGMKFNPTKCYILSVIPNISFYYQLSNSILKHIQNNPYLGILLSNDLTWVSHISAVTNFLRKPTLRWAFYEETSNAAHQPVNNRPILPSSAPSWSMVPSSGICTWRKTSTAWRRHSASQHASSLATSGVTPQAASPDS